MAPPIRVSSLAPQSRPSMPRTLGTYRASSVKYKQFALDSIEENKSVSIPDRRPPRGLRLQRSESVPISQFAKLYLSDLDLSDSDDEVKITAPKTIETRSNPERDIAMNKPKYLHDISPLGRTQQGNLEIFPAFRSSQLAKVFDESDGESVASSSSRNSDWDSVEESSDYSETSDLDELEATRGRKQSSAKEQPLEKPVLSRGMASIRARVFRGIFGVLPRGRYCTGRHKQTRSSHNASDHHPIEIEL